MKILQINSVCGVGSTGRIATDLYKVIESQGHECCIAYGRGSAPDGFKTIKIGADKDVYLHALYTRITDRTGFASKNVTYRFIEQIKDYNPDVIHLHNIHGYYINIGILFDYLAKAGKPVVWTLHDCWAFTGHCSHFDYIGCEKWKSGCRHCPQKHTYPASFFLDNSVRNYEDKKKLFTSVEDMIIVTPSYWLAGLVEQSFLNKYPVKTIHNGIDLDIFKPTESDFRKRHGIDDKFMVLGVASVWGERKGYQYFPKIADSLGDDYQVVLVGVTEKQKRKLPKSILGITKTNNVKELAEIYTAADVFVNPTLEDNFPTTNLEALACVTPVITFNTGGSVECIDNTCGVAVQKGNVDNLIDIIKLLEIDKKEDYSNSCLKKVAENFDKSDNYLSYVKLYNLIIE